MAAERIAVRPFPATRPSVIEALREDDGERRRTAQELLVRAYWQPVAAALQFRWQLDAADVEDLTQEFFMEALARNWLASFDPNRARFRTFLRMCVDRFVANAIQSRRRLKRGGGATVLSLDDAPPLAVGDDPDARFRDEWVRSIFAMSLDALRRECEALGKKTHYAVFVSYDVTDAPEGMRPSYRDLAERHALPETTITNHLAWARRAYRRHVLDALRALAGSDAEFREDARELLGVSVT